MEGEGVTEEGHRQKPEGKVCSTRGCETEGEDGHPHLAASQEAGRGPDLHVGPPPHQAERRLYQLCQCLSS